MSYKFKVACRNFSLLLLCLLLLQSGFAQYNFSKVDDWLSSNLKAIGGRAVLVIFKDGKLLYSRAENELTGRQKRIGKFIAARQGKDADDMLQDFDISSRERIASCSKWLSAALVMTFVDEGKLSMEDSVGKFLPVMTVNGKGHIKIWQCLSHLTGIKASNLKESLTAMKGMNSMTEAIEAIAKQPMEGEPGKAFHYSNTGLQIAAAVIEKISGKDFETLFAERIAKPCNMTNTDFGHVKVPLPAGGAWSTATDYINFLQMILQEGIFKGKQVLSKQAIVEMQKNRVSKDVIIVSSPAEAGNWGYGFGEWITDGATGDQRSDAVTSPGLFGSFPWVDNSMQYAGFLMTFNINSKGRHERYTELKKIVDKSLNTK
jgi:CubicO group peptidase (beta-lactamase class C family)